MKKFYLIIPVCCLLLAGCSQAGDKYEASKSSKEAVRNEITEDQKQLNEKRKKEAEQRNKEKEAAREELPVSFNGLEEVKLNPCDTTGTRKANVMVDIGYGNRAYFARTNEYSQVVEVFAKNIELQDDDNEKVDVAGRYCSEEAMVPGIEVGDMDEGHIIGDALGGVSNAYNITPEESQLNRYGKQADLEETIRSNETRGQQVTDFHGLITYPDNLTQVPSAYAFTYQVNGVEQSISFDNSVPETSSTPNTQSELMQDNSASESTTIPESSGSEATFDQLEPEVNLN